MIICLFLILSVFLKINLLNRFIRIIQIVPLIVIKILLVNLAIDPF